MGPTRIIVATWPCTGQPQKSHIMTETAHSIGQACGLVLCWILCYQASWNRGRWQLQFHLKQHEVKLALCRSRPLADDFVPFFSCFFEKKPEYSLQALLFHRSPRNRQYTEPFAEDNKGGIFLILSVHLLTMSSVLQEPFRPWMSKALCIMNFL